MAEPKNHLLDLLPRKERERLLTLCKTVELPFGQVLWQQGAPVQYVYFPTTSFISMVASLEGEPVLEVGMAGFEGVLGVQLALGVTHAPLHAVVQGAGSAWRVGATAFRREVVNSPALRRVLDQYLSIVMSQLGTSAACVSYHQIGPRLARWLLMTQDRARSGTFSVTHEFLSYMLGVRRVGITSAAGALQAQGLITYHRGKLSVLDRRGLEKASCSCYSTDRAAYAATLK